MRGALRGLLLLGAALSPSAHAATDYGSFDGFLLPWARAHWPAAIDSGGEGEGLGIRTLSRARDRVMVLAEYQYLSYDRPDADTGQYRIGVGWTAPDTASGVFLTYDYLDLDRENAIAFGLHGRLSDRVAGPLSAYASAGYLGTRGSSFYMDGFELNLGATWDLPEPWGLFADYRAVLLDSHDSVERLHTRQWRLGVRFRFDC